MSGRDEMKHMPHNRKKLNTCWICKHSRRNTHFNWLYCVKLITPLIPYESRGTAVGHNETCGKWEKGVDK